MLLLLGVVSAFNIKPLRAGTISLSDHDIRSQSRIDMKIDLSLDR